MYECRIDEKVKEGAKVYYYNSLLEAARFCKSLLKNQDRIPSADIFLGDECILHVYQFRGVVGFLHD